MVILSPLLVAPAESQASVKEGKTVAEVAKVATTEASEEKEVGAAVEGLVVSMGWLHKHSGTELRPLRNRHRP